MKPHPAVDQQRETNRPFYAGSAAKCFNHCVNLLAATARWQGRFCARIQSSMRPPHLVWQLRDWRSVPTGLTATRVTVDL